MNQSDKLAAEQDPLAFLAAGGEMGRLIRSMDWSATPLGSSESWPQSLRTTVSVCLPSSFPMCIAWGPKRVMIYNDGYWPICGGNHPRSMGQDFSECWASAWPVIGEPFARALAGYPSFIENQQMFLDRNGYLEETFFTFSFSPIRDETGGVGGVLNPCHETTAKMLSERRTKALRDLAARTSKAKSVEEVLTLSAQALTDYDLDVPFALLYSLDASGRQSRLVASTGLKAGAGACPDALDLEESAQSVWPLAQVFRTGTAAQVDDIAERLGPPPLGPYPEPPKTALLLPIIAPGEQRPSVVVVFGVSPRLPLNDEYRAFYDLFAASVTAAIANARAYEDERRRAEALAAIDSAKTLFFSNVSHEFRTPLTLLLGPLEDTLAPSNDLPARHRERLEIAHRNSLRLLKLVNTLLDFSRIEARRIQAVYEPTDLGPYTSELASVFRSAVEKAGLKLIVCCPPHAEPVYVDREMWEKIVLNLLSNAFKFTFHGEIKVSFQQEGEAAELIVSDTGTGIPGEELPHLFERFHRVKGARGRTFEGSGIGLALVQELVKLHGGCIDVQSELDRGTAFRLRIPLGIKHLPADRIGATRTQTSTTLRGKTFVEEALTWLPEVPVVNDSLCGDAHPQNGSATTHDAALTPDKSRILLAEDNADMRAYVCRMLSERYEVEAVQDGLAALKAARRNPPALILSDVMMPEMDGFELVREVRAEEKLQDLPIILLSARAGEEARVEGVTQGADDYLTKPFSARELLARVATHLQLARVRRQAESSARESEERLRQLNEQLEHRVAARTAALQREVLERRTAEEQIKNLLRQLVTAEEQERQRIARELHDTLGQQLASLHLSIEVLRAQADGDATMDQHIVRMRQTLDHLNSHLDFLAWELRPPALDMLGLDAALENYVREWSQLFEIEAEYQGLAVQGLRLAPEAETNLYRIFQEVLQNVYKHSGATQVHVIFERRGGDALLIVEDNGQGYDAKATRNARDGMGLINIRERAALIGGSIEIETEPGQGTTVFVRVPIAVESIEGRSAGEAALPGRL